MEPQELDQLREHYDQSMALAKTWGLAPYAVDFHVCPADRIYEVASYGVPGHFSHWTYGRDFWIFKMQYDHGLSKIYELVINADPAQAFLLDVNSTLENMFVISHVIGHSDFFANNAYFSHTNRAIEHSTVAAAERFREYELQYGRRVVEAFIDDVITIKDHINPHLRIQKRPDDYELSELDDPYGDLFPTETKKRESHSRLDRIERMMKIEPEQDILLFIADHAPYLSAWERDIVQTFREEMYYFLPAYQTKIMNEGWASLIHRTMMHTIESDIDPGGIEFAEMHSRVLSGIPGRLNPYWIGYNIYLRIIEKYGEHSPEEMQSLAFIGGKGWEKALEVREIDSDESFIRNYLDRELVERLDLFAFEFYEPHSHWEVTETREEWEVVRDTFVQSRTSMMHPQIAVQRLPNGELVLEHAWDGRPLQDQYARKTLEAVCRIWGTAVTLVTKDDEEKEKKYRVTTEALRRP